MTSSPNQSLTHFNAQGQVHMVDVGDKAHTHRVALVAGHITMQAATLALIENGSAKKGDVLGIARIAAIQASKRTADLIPLCHPLALSRVTVEFTLAHSPPAVHIAVQCETTGPTGVEMEALTAASVGLLTVYDMCKAVDRGMTIAALGLVHKAGGKSGEWHAQA